MILKEKIELKEKVVKTQIDFLRSALNDASKFSKENPNDWKYLTMLTTCENTLQTLNEELNAIKM